MESFTWTIQTSPARKVPMIVSEYVLNEQGVFVKREKRVSKNEPLTAITGFKVGYHRIPDTDYRAAPLDRDVILWQKMTSAVVSGPDTLTITGNARDIIEVKMPADSQMHILRFIDRMRRQNPVVENPDEQAAIWMCWRDDDDWGDNPYRPLQEMIDEEASVERFIDPDILEETRLDQVPGPFQPFVADEAGEPAKQDTRFLSGLWRRGS